MSHHPADPHAGDAFWGLLATRPDRRGERIALLLGAQAMVTMWEVHGARGFMTGVQGDNASSMALCRRIGVTPSDRTFIGCIDPATFGDPAITK